MPKKFYLTTAIPYVNAAPHIGFGLELVQADTIARSQRQRGKDVFFLTGADENSLKNVQAAEQQRMPVQALVDRNSQKFIDLAAVLSISNDVFIRTATHDHEVGAQKLWSACRPDDIYKKKYTGLYCVGCEQFYTEKELIDGTCPEHHTTPEVVEEENYFFRLSCYQKKLEQLISSDRYLITPTSRKNEVLSFIRMGLQDFSISRSQARAKHWGVPVPGDPDQVMYVWFDALSNYITALDYGGAGARFKTYWPADIHCVGKGIIRFHAVYWPAMLLSAGLALPKQLCVHGYINIGGEKMSKSQGNVVDPFALIDRYGVDAVRYYLLRYIHPIQDSDFNQDQFEIAYNADLANGIGNLVSRVAGLVEQNSITVPPGRPLKLTPAVAKAIDQFSFDVALKLIWQRISILDGYISTQQPWVLAKEGKTAALKKVLVKAVTELRQISVDLKSFLPNTATTIEQTCGAEKMVKGPALFERITK